MIVINGSRLQALIYSWAGVVALVVLRNTSWLLGFTCAVLGVGLGLSVALRRVELGRDTVTARSILGSTTDTRSSVDCVLGHRYLSLRFANNKTHRIEVPVEVRPNVRDWVAGGAPTNGA